MAAPHFQQLGLIGCGLMGGSLALGLKQAGLVQRVLGYSPSVATREQALHCGAIDQACTTPEDAARGSDLILVAVPVRATQACLQAIAPLVADDALVMDVGSTKCDVVQAARAALGARLSQFVPAHPIAGKEKAGIAHAEATLYQDRALILTPLPETPAERIDKARALWQALGSRVHILSPEAHDRTFAAVSHVPHLIAFAAVHALTQQNDAAELLRLAGPGFRDFSRIAASDPAVWRDIFLANPTQVLAQARLFQNALGSFAQAIADGDAQGLHTLITQASQTRAQWQLGAATQDTDL